MFLRWNDQNFKNKWFLLDILAVTTVWWGTWNYEREKTMKPDGRIDVKVEIVMWMFKEEAKVIQMVLM